MLAGEAGREDVVAQCTADSKQQCLGHVTPASVLFSSRRLSKHLARRCPLLVLRVLMLLLLLPLLLLLLMLQEYNEHVHVLLTTKSAEAIALLSSSLPSRVRGSRISKFNSHE